MREGSPEHFWWEKINQGGGWVTYTIGVIILMILWQLASFSHSIFAALRFPFRLFSFRSLDAPPQFVRHSNNSAGYPSTSSQPRISSVITDLDLKNLIDDLDDKINNANERWESVIDRRNSFLSYSAKCCKPKDSPLKYVSMTVFEDCSAEMLRDFYMDSDYRKLWDKTLIEQDLLQLDESKGIEVGRTLKKFPLLTPREYVLAWRLWEGADTYYCFSKECQHPLAPRQKKYVRVRFLRSGWRIRKVPGRNACEIKMVHQEDAGLNAEMAKLAFAKGIWSYMSKMNTALRKYSAIDHLQRGSTVNAITLAQKIDNFTGSADTDTSTESASSSERVENNRRFPRRPSYKLMGNGLILLGGVFCLSRGHSNLGAKVAMAYILSKLTKRSTSTTQKQPSEL